jgi:hypothetical protein
MGQPLSAEVILVACPVCEAWPMVVNTRNGSHENANVHLPKMAF